MNWLNAKEPYRGISLAEIREKLFSVLSELGSFKKILIIPPDFTRVHSWAGSIAEILWEFYGNKISTILPALGTHEPMKPEEIHKMFGKVPSSLFPYTTGKRILLPWDELQNRRWRKFHMVL